jgi:DNA primase
MIDRFRLGFAPADRGWLFAFLSGKGYSPQFLAASGLFSDKYPRSSFFSNRLMFPISDRQGKTVAFGGRILEGEGPKYINSRESDIYKKGQTLFAIDLALPAIRRTKEVYLAEGYMDVISLHQAGIANAVAPLGTAFTDDQAKLLRRWAERINLVFDSDSAGQAAAVKAVITCRRNGLASGVVVPAEGGALPAGAGETASVAAEAQGVWMAALETGEKTPPAGPDLSNLKDPADILRYLGPEALQKRMKCIIYDFEYLVLRSRSLYDISGSEGKARAVAFLFPYIETLDSEVSRDACLASVADAFGTDRAAVLNDYNRNARQSSQRGQAGEKSYPTEGSAQGVSLIDRPVQMNDELVLLAVILVNFHLYPIFRNAVSIKEIGDPAAKELIIAMEECYIHEESGIDDLLSRISSPALRNYVVEKGTAGEFSGTPRQQQDQLEQLIKDGVRKVKQKRLRLRLSEITSEIHRLEHDPSPKEEGFRRDSRLEELIVEKMHIDAELHQ